MRARGALRGPAVWRREGMSAGGRTGDTQHTFLSPRRRPSLRPPSLLWPRERVSSDGVSAIGSWAIAPVQFPRWMHRCRACGRLAVSTRTFRRLALASAVMLVVIVASGATVRLTGSGLGCQHWPGARRATRSRRPATTRYIEFSNRIVASFAILATLATFVASLRAPGAALGALGRRARVPRDAPAGAARHDHRLLQAEPLARRHALPALDRRARTGRARRARGVEHPRRAASPPRLAALAPARRAPPARPARPA